MLLAALMIVILLSFGGLVLFALNPSTSDERLRQLQIQLEQLRLAVSALEKTNASLRQEIEKLKLEPPFFEIADADVVTFNKGEAIIHPAFSAHLQNKIFPLLLKTINDMPKVDTIEIIGHTDDSGIGKPRSNLDTKLPLAFSGNLSASDLTAGSNTDLGLMRAVAVREVWIRWLGSPGIVLPRKIGIRCYSAANTIPPPEKPGESADDHASRARRIEIRFTKLKSSNSQH